MFSPFPLGIQKMFFLRCSPCIDKPKASEAAFVYPIAAWGSGSQVLPTEIHTCIPRRRVNLSFRRLHVFPVSARVPETEFF